MMGHIADFSGSRQGRLMGRTPILLRNMGFKMSAYNDDGQTPVMMSFSEDGSGQQTQTEIVEIFSGAITFRKRRTNDFISQEDLLSGRG